MSASATDKTPGARIFKGITINPGRVSARTCLFSGTRHKQASHYSLENEDEAASDLKRFAKAQQECSEELEHIAAEVETSIGKAEAEIFITQRHIMNDPKIVDGIVRLVKTSLMNVEWAIGNVLGEFEEKMASLDNQYLRERSGDIGEVRQRLLNKLGNREAGFICEGQMHCSRGAHRIIVAEELTPNMIVNMDMKKVLGFVTEHGGVTSHAAILARSLGVPAVSGIENIMQSVNCGDTLLLNADAGEVYLNPGDELINSLMQPVTGDVCALVTVSPAGTEVAANASTIEDVKMACAMHADGIGLFRTEILFVGAERLLTEDEQFDHYRQVLSLMGEKTVTFRMLDIGGDKPLPFLRLKKEANPFLGWRGARFLLGNPDIFRSQIRALGRLSRQGRLRILFPMIIDAPQLAALIAAARDALSGIEHDSANIDYGAMFEVPSAILQAREIMRQTGFTSIGSNDLIQYMFAIDRGNEMVSRDYNPDHPALWTFLGDLSAASRDTRKPLSICGEMAGREGMPSRLADIGIVSFSVSPRLIPRIRDELQRGRHGPGRQSEVSSGKDGP